MGDERDPGMESSRPPTHRNGAIWTERSFLVLIVISLAVTFNLMLAIHRQTPPQSAAVETETTTAPIAPPPVLPKPVAPSQAAAGDSGGIKPAIAQRPPEQPDDRPPPEDPTRKAVAALSNATGREIDEAQQSDRRASALETARLASVEESRRWKRRELLVRQQIAGLADRANQLESDADTLDAERDVLARERDALKAALVKAGRRTGFAVLPYKGPNGTWRRPIVLECASGSVKLQPKGVSFSSMDLSPLINPRSSPLIRAVARELLHIQAADTPDGAPAVPYLVFLVRPSGIRLYYEARTCLEPLGIAFGYELIEQDLVVEIPNFDNLVTWDGSVPLDIPLEPAPGRRTTVAVNSQTGDGSGSPAGSQSGSPGNRPALGGWPERSDRNRNSTGGDQGNTDAASPEDFVWPTRGRQSAGGGRPSSTSDAADSNGGSIRGDDGGLSAPAAGGSPAGFPAGGSGTGSLGSREHSPPGTFGTGDTAGLSTTRGGGGGRTSGNDAPGAGNGSSFTSAGGADSSSNSITQGGGSTNGLDPNRSPTGSGSVVAGGSGQYSLPDLQPIGDGDSSLMTRSSMGRSQGSNGSSGGSGLEASDGQAGQPASATELSSAASASGLVSAPALGLASAAPSGVSAPSLSMPSSSSSSVASSASPGGIPTSSSSTASSSSSSSSLFSLDDSSGSQSSDSDRIFVPAPKREPPRGSIEVPFEIVVVCRENDLLLHPGGYRLTTQAMRSQGANKESLLIRELVAMVRKRAIVDPLIRPKPRLRFLVESNGSETYWTARRQLVFSLPDWPMSLQVSGTHDSRVFTKETW